MSGRATGPLKPNNMITDFDGAQRYTMSRTELHYVYKKLDDFRADCMHNEYIQHKAAFDEIFALIHTHIKNTKRNSK